MSVKYLAHSCPREMKDQRERSLRDARGISPESLWQNRKEVKIKPSYKDKKPASHRWKSKCSRWGKSETNHSFLPGQKLPLHAIPTTQIKKFKLIKLDITD